MNRSAFAGAVDAEDSANELNDLIEELIQRVIAVTGAFAICNTDAHIIAAFITKIVAVFVNVVEL